MAAVDQRYAQALFDLTQQGKGDAARLNQELASVAEALRSSPALAVVLASPRVEPHRKLAVIDEIVRRLGASRYTRNLVAVAIDRGRVGALDAIQRAFAELLRRQQGLVRADVTSARELAADEKTVLERELGKLTGRRIEASYRRDPALVGGFTVRIEDTVYDASIRGRLLRLREALATAQS